MICKRCGTDENRVHGFCGINCQDKVDDEEEIRELKERWEDLERWVKQQKISCTGGDRFWAGYDDYHGDVKAKMRELNAANKQER